MPKHNYIIDVIGLGLGPHNLTSRSNAFVSRCVKMMSIVQIGDFVRLLLVAMQNKTFANAAVGDF